MANKNIVLSAHEHNLFYILLYVSRHVKSFITQPLHKGNVITTDFIVH